MPNKEDDRSAPEQNKNDPGDIEITGGENISNQTKACYVGKQSHWNWQNELNLIERWKELKLIKRRYDKKENYKW